MACFLVPAAAAIITTGAKNKIPQQYHPEWLEAMLWGGVAMLLVDHLISGEFILSPPFLTAMNTPEETVKMVEEITTTGVLMTLAVFSLWIVLILKKRFSTKKNILQRDLS